MTIKYYPALVQGTDEWLKARCGLLTASEMKHIITEKKLEYAKGEKEKTHLFDLLDQRVYGYVEPTFQSWDMRRGKEEEFYARQEYDEAYARVQDMGFITNDKWGFTLGYSPDGLVGDDGQIECKSRAGKYQVETILGKCAPSEFMIQVQTGLLVSERPWCDFISYSNGRHMYVIRVLPDPFMQEKIIEAATIFHEKLENLVTEYRAMLESPDHRLIKTEYRNYEEITGS